MIIDSHVHISYLKPGESLSQARDKLLLSMKDNGIDYSFVIPDNVKNPGCADLDTAMKLIKDEKRLFLIGTLKIEEIDNQNLAKIEGLFKTGTIKGFKIFPGHDPVYPNDKRWAPIYDLCVKYDLPLIIHTGINTNDEECAKFNDPKYVVETAKKYRLLKIIIAHYFWPRLDYCFEMTEDVPNIYFDTSALADPEVTEASGGIKKVAEILEKTIKRKPDSVIFGTDWPMCNVKKHIDLIDSLSIPKIDKENIFYKNCLKIFKIKKPSR